MERQLRSDLHAPRRVEGAITPDAPRDLIDVVLYHSPLLRVGRWRCPVAHPAFRDSGPASETLFVFPRESVWIQHEGREPFVANANTVTYYNAGQRYRRSRLSTWGDRCEWFAFSPEVVTELLAVYEPATKDRPDRPFRFTHGPADSRSYLRQRLVFQHISRERVPDRLFVEETMCEVLSRVAGIAYAQAGRTVRDGKPSSRDTEVAEAARDLIARRYRDALSLADIALSVSTSVFHLARLFRRRTGFSLHQYRNHLRLRAALEHLIETRVELSALALDLGFSSHSHFTESFRRAFGHTPSAVRRVI